MSKDNINIDWNYAGKTDLAFGTGATRTESGLGWLACILGVALYGYFFVIHAFPWTLWQYLIAVALAFDVIGGLVANSLNSCKRLYFSLPRAEESQTTHLLKNHIFFTALHIHPFIIGLVFGGGNWSYGLFWYAALLGSVLIVLNVPLYLRRPVAMLIILLAILLNALFILPITGFAWFIPALFLKIVYGHGVREEPYRPASKLGKDSLSSPFSNTL